MDPLLAALRDAREDRGLTQREVGERMGTTQSAVARLENGDASPRMSTLQAYATAVGAGLSLTPPDLVGDCADAIRRALGNDDADAALRAVVQFVDDALAAGDVELLLREPPSTDSAEWDAAIAAAVAWVARQLGDDTPGWTAAPSRFLDGPWFPVEDILGCDVGAGLAAYLLANAPGDFFGRGVIIDPATLASL